MARLKLLIPTFTRAMIAFSVTLAASSWAQQPLKFPPAEGNPQNSVPGSFWSSQNMPSPAVQPQIQTQQQQQQQRMRPVQNPAGNFSFQPRNRGYGNPGHQPPQAYANQRRNQGGYWGQRPPSPAMNGYRPYPPQQQYRGGPGWGNGANNFGPFSRGPFGNNSMWSGGPFSWFKDGPKEGMANAWEEMLHAPSDMGEMPGGWNFPDVGVPNPVDVGDQFGEAGEALATEMPEFAREIPDMFNFRPY